MKSDIVQVSFFCIEKSFQYLPKINELNIKTKYFVLYNEHKENFHLNNFRFILKKSRLDNYLDTQ